MVRSTPFVGPRVGRPMSLRVEHSAAHSQPTARGEGFVVEAAVSPAFRWT